MVDKIAPCFLVFRARWINSNPRNMKAIMIIMLGVALTSCTVTEEQASQLSGLVEVAGVLMSEEDAAKLEALQAMGEVVITVEESK